MRHPISHFLAFYNNRCHVSQIRQRTPFCRSLRSAIAGLPQDSGETWGEMFVMGLIYWRKQLLCLVGGSQRRSETRRSPSALDFKSPKLACSFLCLSLCTEQHDHCLPPESQLLAGDKRESQCSRGEDVYSDPACMKFMQEELLLEMYKNVKRVNYLSSDTELS